MHTYPHEFQKTRNYLSHSYSGCKYFRSGFSSSHFSFPSQIREREGGEVERREKGKENRKEGGWKEKGKREQRGKEEGKRKERWGGKEKGKAKERGEEGKEGRETGKIRGEETEEAEGEKNERQAVRNEGFVLIYK